MGHPDLPNSAAPGVVTALSAPGAESVPDVPPAPGEMPGEIAWTPPPEGYAPLPDGPADFRGRGRRKFAFPAAFLAFVLVVGFVAYRIRDDSASPYPDRWDPRVVDLVGFVERERGHRFEHPVAVDFLANAEFDKQVTSDSNNLSDEERRSLERAGGFLRAVGLASGPVDVLRETNALQSSGVLAIYSFATKRVVVQGTKMNLATEVTLVHELTHALDDQEFDLAKLSKDAEAEHRSAALRALIEGTASIVEEAFVASMTTRDRTRYRADQESQSESFEKSTSGVPPVFKLLLAAPDAFGPRLVDVLKSTGGNSAIDAAFADPPVSEEQYINPIAYVDRDNPNAVSAPDLRVGETDVEPDADPEFGLLGWYMVLSERLDARDVWRVAQHWGGDSYKTIERGGRTCVVANYVGQTPPDTAAMKQLLDRWIVRMPGSDATANIYVGTLRFETCDPGRDARLATGDSEDAFGLPVARTALIGEFVKADVPVEVATCLAEGLALEYSPREISGSELPAGFREAVEALHAECA